MLQLKNEAFQCFVRHLDLDTLIKLSLLSTEWRTKLRICRDLSIFYRIEVEHENFFYVTVTNSEKHVFTFQVLNGGPNAARTLRDTLRLSNISMTANTFVTIWREHCIGVRDIVAYCQNFFCFRLYTIDLLNCQVQDLTTVLRYLRSPSNFLRIYYDRRFFGEYKRITFRHLKNFDTPTIHLTDFRITCDVVNAFLSYWQHGGGDRTRCLYVILDRVNLDKIFAGIEFLKRDPDVIRNYGNGDSKTPVIGGFDIRRIADRKIATCCFWPDNSFKMFVW